MAERSNIEWTDATINFWIGCTEVSPACDNCYAREMAKRYGWAKWGHGEPRHKTKGAVANARALERKAERAQRRIKVFSNSLSDFGDAEVPDDWRDEVVGIWAETPWLDWLILSKRPKVVRDYLSRIMVPHHLCDGGGCNYCGDHDGWVPWRSYPFPNVAIGTTVENRAMAALRIPLLRETPAARRFLSIEPLLEDLGEIDLTGIDWVIVGGESGRESRPMHPDWARSLRDQCAAAGVPFFFKQWGAWEPRAWKGDGATHSVRGTDGAVHKFDHHPNSGERAEKATPGWHAIANVGKGAAGRLLDGREHNEFPRLG